MNEPWQEPNCDMDLDVYKDWLYEFNNNNELRDVNFSVFASSVDHTYNYHCYYDFPAGSILTSNNGSIMNYYDAVSFGDPSFCYSEGYGGEKSGIVYRGYPLTAEDNNYLHDNYCPYGNGASYSDNFSGNGIA